MSSWKDYFTFDKRQRNGVAVLLILIGAVIAARLLLPVIVSVEPQPDSDFERRVSDFEESVIDQNDENPKKKDQNLQRELFKFDPNKLPREKWLMLGLKDWQIDVIHSYESKGGKFRSKEDLKKIYGIKDELYQTLEPYIQISDGSSFDESSKKNITLFKFNPNHLPEAKWKMLGLDDWQIRIIYNYESKGGKFKTKEDLSNIYGINPKQYQRLEPYIIIPGDDVVVKVQLTTSSKLIEISPSNFNGLDGVSYYEEHGFYKYTFGEFNSEDEAKQALEKVKASGYDSSFLIAFKDGKKIDIKTAFQGNTKKKFVESRKEKAKVELNEADSVELLTIYGVGPAYAHRIIQFRERTGGFKNKEQLMEIYGITSDNYPKIAEQVTVDSTKIVRINLNQCTYVDLVKHPLISKNVANSLINYRKTHGHYQRVEDIQNSDLVNEDLYLKIAPYFKVE